jgi:predicted peptidase
MSFVTVLFGVSLFALQRTAQADYWLKYYEAKTYESAHGRTLPYRLLKPDQIESGKSYPLVLFLHGAGERGSDNAQQLSNAARQFARPINRRKYPCFVLAPQCPSGKSWSVWSKHAMLGEPTVPMKLALELLDRLVAELPVDKNRIYVTGLSMGGHGTWDVIARRPGYFAAAMPICGGGDPAQAAKMTKLPIWAFHGDRDDRVPYQRTVEMIEAIRQAGGEPKMTIFRGVDHDCWGLAYGNPAVLDWLFAQKKTE